MYNLYNDLFVFDIFVLLFSFCCKFHWFVHMFLLWLYSRPLWKTAFLADRGHFMPMIKWTFTNKQLNTFETYEICTGEHLKKLTSGKYNSLKSIIINTWIIFATLWLARTHPYISTFKKTKVWTKPSWENNAMKLQFRSISFYS